MINIICVYISKRPVQILKDHLTIIAIFEYIATFFTGNFLNYLGQDFLVSIKIFLGNISLSSISFLSLVSWFTCSTIFSIISRIARFSWSTRCSFKIITRLSFRTRWSRSSRSSRCTLSSLVTLVSPWAISWAFLDEIISIFSSFTSFSWLSRFTRFSIFTWWTLVTWISRFSLVTWRSL